MSYGPKRQNNALYGDGSDGDLAITSGTTTLTGDMYWNSLTIDSGATLDTAGYKFFVKTKAIINGLIHNNGLDGSGSSGGAGGVARSVGGGGVGDIGNDDLPESTFADVNSIGGTSGAGGDGTITGGSSGVSAGSIPAPSGGLQIASSYPFCFMGYVNTGTSGQIKGGAGGGGGGGSTGGSTNPGGGGGGGGGIVLFAIKDLSGTGSITSTGGNGVDAPSVDTGGGGGGGGGGIICITGNDPTYSGITFLVDGGIGGLGDGSGKAGEDGLPGNIYYVRNSI